MEHEIALNKSIDIVVMKVHTILRGGTKKDFFDIAEILEQFSIDQIIDWYNQRYPNRMLRISFPHALIYFADADESEDPVSLHGQTWASVKRLIKEKVNDYLK